jgi:thiosulfate dehydrogenase (quinone) large subunit
MAATTSRRFRRDTVYIEEPRASRWLFGSSTAAWLWLVARLWLGWEWFQSGWGKVFGGEISLDGTFRFSGDNNIGWVRRSGDVGVGDSVAGFADRAIESAEGPHPDVAYSWYVTFLEWIRDTSHPVLGPMVAVGELVIGALLILGLFTGMAAFLGAVLNFSFVFAGSAGVNPAMILVSGLLILAWRNAGWWGLDRWVLPRLGTPWHRGTLVGGKPDETGDVAEREDVRGSAVVEEREHRPG